MIPGQTATLAIIFIIKYAVLIVTPVEIPASKFLPRERVMEASVIGDERYRGRSDAWTRLQFDMIQYLTCLIVQDVLRWVISPSQNWS
jgi:hypothetical protein